MINQALINQLDMINALIPSPDLIVGGQPTQDDLKRLAAAGAVNIVNLRPTSEKIDYDEARLVHQLGMNYYVIPVTEIESFTQDAAKALLNILAQKQPCLVHCASGNRVGALIALAAFWLEETSAVDAMTLGLQAGLTKLQPQVADILSLEG
ncbi:phosphatase domain-containing putative toxin [Thalassotalea fusca]